MHAGLLFNLDSQPGATKIAKTGARLEQNITFRFKVSTLFKCLRASVHSDGERFK